MADIKITADSSDIQTLRRELVGVAKDAKSSASVFEREYAKVERILNSNAKASQAHYKSLLGLDTVSKSASKSASVFAAELNKADAAIKANTTSLNQFKSSYDRSFAVEQKTLQLKQLLRQEIANGTMTVRQAGAELLNYRKALVASGLAQTGFGKSMNRSGVVTQQAGYQIGDFLVQVQSGTNWMVAFGQQATQLVGILPLMGSGFLGLSSGALVALSAGLGIAIPLVTAIGAYFLRAGDNAEKGSGGISTFTGAIQALTAEIQNNQEVFLKLKFDTESSGVAGASQQIEELRKKIPVVRAELDAFNMAVAQAGGINLGPLFGDEGDELEANLKSLEDQLSTLMAQEEAQRMLNGGMSVAAGIQKGLIYDKTVELRVAKELEAAQKAVNAALSSGDADAFNSAMNDALAAGVKFSQLDLSTVVAMAARNGWSLAGAMRAVWAAAQGGPLVNANPAAGPGFEGGGRNRNVIPPQKYQQTFQDILNSQSKKGGGGGGGQTQEEYLQQLLREDEQKRKLIGLSESEQSAMETEFSLREKLRDLKGSVTEEEIQSTLRQIEATNKLIEQETRREEMMASVSSSIENAFMSMVEGSQSVGDAFKGMIREIILDIYRQQVAKPFADFITGLFMANGGAFSNGSQVTAYANGGVVGSPTMFKHSGGLGLMGEAGPEAIMPLKRGSNGKLGVQVDGKSGGNITVVQNNNFGAGVSRAEIQAMMPKIVETTKAAVLDAKKRGGSYGSAFA